MSTQFGYGHDAPRVLELRRELNSRGALLASALADVQETMEKLTAELERHERRHTRLVDTLRADAL